MTGHTDRTDRLVALTLLRQAEHVLFVGDEANVSARLRRYAELGATDILFAPFAWGSDKQHILARTRAFIASLVPEAASW